MKRGLVILGLCAAAAAGCTQTRVVHDNSVAAQFAVFNNRSGWKVSGGEINKPQPGDQGNMRVISSSNPLSHPVWKTNFQVDPADSGAVAAPSGVAPPPPSTPGSSLLGGYLVPSASGSQAATQPAKAPAH